MYPALPVCLMDALVRELRQQGDEEAMAQLEEMLEGERRG